MSDGNPRVTAGNSTNVNNGLEPRKDVVGGALFAALQVVFLAIFTAIQGEDIDVEALVGALSLLLAGGFAYMFRTHKVYAAAVGGGLSILIGSLITWLLGGQVDVAAVSTALTTLSFIAVQIGIQLRPPEGLRAEQHRH